MRVRIAVYGIFLLFGIFTIGCMKDEFGGIGVEVPTGSGKVSESQPYIISSVFKGGSGEAAGLRNGDRIISINGKSLDTLEYEFIVTQLLRGKVGTVVTLEVERLVNGDKVHILVRVPRMKIVLQE